MAHDPDEDRLSNLSQLETARLTDSEIHPPGNSQHSKDPLVGKIFAGRFIIEQVLGEGGMGKVYLGQQIALDRPVAIKMIRRDLLGSQNAIGRFRREARSISRIKHPKILAIFDFGFSDDDGPYLVMEYVDGVSLEKVLQRDPILPPRRAHYILIQVAEALEAAHKAKVIHRDLKAGNIMLTSHGTAVDSVKVVDFGLAKILESEATTGLTTKNSIFGSPPYMSPEQVTGSKTDYRTDIYSFGVLSFQLLTGRLPFTGTVQEVIRAHVVNEPQVPSSVWMERYISPAMDRFILRCMAKKPEDRYQDAATLSRELSTLFQGL